MADFKNIVILGDSMSDIGNKWLWPSGELGRMFGAMRVNETGRFSDGKNWTDFLIEWSTGEALMWGNSELTIRKSTDYRTLSRNSVLGVDTWDKQLETRNWKDLDDFLAEAKQKKPTVTLPEITYVNYSMGGCIATRDWTWAPKFGMLTYLKGQVDDYVAQRGALGKAFSGPTLHIIWIGLNDFVTAERPDYDPHDVTSVPATDDYAAWKAWHQDHPKEVQSGVGVFPAVAETQALIEQINSSFPAAKADNHFLVIDLPSVYNAVRYMEGLGEPGKIAKAKVIDPIIRRYNNMLLSLARNWPAGPDAPDAQHLQLVEMSKWMDYLSLHLDEWKLSKLAQDKGVAPFYRGGLPPTPKTDPHAPDVRRRITTSDLGHPTEAVYSLMARYVVTKLLHKGNTLGRLNMHTWYPNAPFKDHAFDAPGEA